MLNAALRYVLRPRINVLDCAVLGYGLADINEGASVFWWGLGFLFCCLLSGLAERAAFGGPKP